MIDLTKRKILALLSGPIN